ncbi:MAG: hypothetical protein DSM107014_12885 [Gomphosphaeria aponina SAG 52.96 = DSM 107014]|uniref:Uncharacterized protein n=1 Tax=Gomphosphaeria aponina SAG 52.96 = DSM 107014 TaxID=1521640 RepID=A0A941JVD8_9CHRO|nr:hypothetical protein [Gomphosphaeria aponina SAG 52.96 = DSM 107014]
MARIESKGLQDGSWQWYLQRTNEKLLEAIADFNSGTKRVSLVHNGSFTTGKEKQPTVISCQFSAIPSEGGSKTKQYKLGLGDCDWSLSGLELAKERAKKISLKLIHNEFTWDWFNEYIKGHKPVDEMAELLQVPIQKWIDKLYATKKGQIKPSSWHNTYMRFFNRFYGKLERKESESMAAFNARKAQLAEEYKQKPLSEQLIRNCIEATSAYTAARFHACHAIKNLLKVADLQDYFGKLLKEYELTTDYETKERNVPSDAYIKRCYHSSFEIKRRGAKKYHANVAHWQWLYGLLACYGLRIHEAWNIANWDSPVVLKGGMWVEVGNDELEWQSIEANLVIPAFNDPSNVHHKLAVKHTTKTGYRVAIPLSPPGEDWVREFDIHGELRLPEMKDPLSLKRTGSGTSYYCSHRICYDFRNRELGFTPHDLRHAYNHRGRVLEISVPAIALSLGHSEGMNSSTYAKHMAMETKNKILETAISRIYENEHRSSLSLNASIAVAKEIIAAKDCDPSPLNELLAVQYGVDNPLKL